MLLNAGILASANQGGGSGYDTDAQAYIDNLTGTYSTAELDAINDFVLATKTAGIWTTRDVIYLMCAKNATDAVINMRQPGTYDGTVVGSYTHTADQGFSGASNSDYLDTGFNPSTAGGSLAESDASMSIYVRNNIVDSQSADSPAAGILTGDSLAIEPRNAFNQIRTWILRASSTSVSSITDSSGLTSIHITSATDRRISRNGSQVGSLSTSDIGSPPNANVYVGAANRGALNPVPPVNHEIAYFQIGGGMTNTEESDHFTAVEALLDAFGAGVVA